MTISGFWQRNLDLLGILDLLVMRILVSLCEKIANVDEKCHRKKTMGVFKSSFNVQMSGPCQPDIVEVDIVEVGSLSAG